MSGNVVSLKQSKREATIQAWLTAKISEWLAIDAREINIQEPFASYGLSSIAAISLAGDLADWLGVELSPILAYEYPTIESLTRYLSNDFDLTRGSGEVQ